MAENVLLGKGRHLKEIPRDSWEKKVAIESQHIPAVLDFMTREHHLARNLVVRRTCQESQDEGRSGGWYLHDNGSGDLFRTDDTKCVIRF